MPGLIVFSAICWLFAATALPASTDQPAIAAICEKAALAASRESGVPLDVLRAISLTETGRKGKNGFLPWPWTVNMEGAGKWFDDLESARRYVDRHFNRGARSFDVGCFQINYKWHGDAFASIDEMFEPLANARYAAKFLTELYEEFGDWSKAAGAFHSRTPKYAKKYTARFDRIRNRLEPWNPVRLVADEPLAPAEIPALAQVAVRENRYPLLQAGPAGSVGSLVPLSQNRRSLIDISRAVALKGLGG
ncbi:MAG: transglycosylase SLT domain-containing protein [Silicimonas sp.]|nr:transglycosylase SLT domain-containing protein [Silicimonas sp.]